MAKLKSFEQFLSEMDRTEEVQQDVVATAEPVLVNILMLNF